MIAIQEKTMKVIDPCDGLILRFKNDLGGRDLVHFAGNYAKFFEVKTDLKTDIDVKDFGFGSLDRAREKVLKKSTQDKIQCSRFFPAINADGFKQLLSSRYIEIYTGIKNDDDTSKALDWIEVQVSLREWQERVKENLIFIAIEIILPERFKDEY
jgi:hypothetical protein